MSVSPQHCWFDGRLERHIFCGLLSRANEPKSTGLEADFSPLQFSIWVSICAGACFELKIGVFQSDPIFWRFLFKIWHLNFNLKPVFQQLLLVGFHIGNNMKCSTRSQLSNQLTFAKICDGRKD